MGFKHNSETVGNEPAWSEVDKSRLPRIAFADEGDAGDKSTWRYPHHWVMEGGDPDERGIYTSGTMVLHGGGLNAAWAAAHGARSGEAAPAAVRSHLQSHRRALGLMVTPISGHALDPVTIRLAAGAIEPARPSGRAYQATLITSGENLNHWILPADVLASALPLFAGAPCLLDHPGLFEYPSLRNLVGTYEAPAFQDLGDQETITATLRLADTPAGDLFARIYDAWLADRQAGKEVPPIGLSANLSVRFRCDDADCGQPGDRRVAREITNVWSVDAVLHPAAGGAVEHVLNSAFTHAGPNGPEPLVTGAAAGSSHTVARSAPPPSGGITMPEEITPPVGAALVAAPSSPTVGATLAAAPSSPVGASLVAAPTWETRLADVEAALVAARAGSTQPTDRPHPAPTTQDTVQALANEVATLKLLVEHIRDTTAKDEEARTIQGMGAPRLFGGRSSLEQVTLAAEALINGTRPAGDIAPLSGIRELYHLLSGDYEMTGMFQPDRVYLAAVTSATMANICADALNKAVVTMFMQYPRWWQPIVTVVNFTTLQDARWITLGGVGELPTVAEGAAYTELTWDDQQESDSFVKKGGYLGLTIEAIDKDDTGRIQAAPRALAQAAWLTLAKSVSDIFTANSGVGPTLDTDSVALFNAAHSNLGSTALSWTAWAATRTAMRKQAEVNSSERLGALTAPRYLLVPPDLEITALQILASEGEPGTADNDANPFARGNSFEARMNEARRRVIVVDLWTDTNNWATVADPNLYPSIGLGFRYGSTPEIFSVASPTAGLMFTNDTMPIKVRFFYAVGPTDYRGLYKHNVS